MDILEYHGIASLSKVLVHYTKVMEYEDQLSLGIFLRKLKRHMGKLLKDNSTTTQTHQQRTIATFLLMLQVNQGIHKQVLDQDITKRLQQIRQ